MGAGVSPGAAAGRLQRRLLARVPRSASGWPSPPVTSPWPSIWTSSWSTRAPDFDVRTLPGRLSTALPVGVDATAAELIAPGTLSLQEDVTSCTWRWVAAPKEGPDPLGEEELAARVAALLAASSVVVTRTRKGEELTDDIRAGILNLQLLGPVGPDPSHGIWLEAELACRPRTLRPSEVLVALDPDLEERHVRRTHQWILRDGARREPLVAADPLRRDGTRRTPCERAS